MQKSKLTLGFRIGHYNGTMSLRVLYNDLELMNCDRFEKDYFMFSTDITLPGRLKCIVGNKNVMTDTKIDDQGNIVADKFIILDNMSLGHVTVDSVTIRKICQWHDRQGKVLAENFWGWPGQAVVDFSQPTVLQWHFANNL